MLKNLATSRNHYLPSVSTTNCQTAYYQEAPLTYRCSLEGRNTFTIAVHIDLRTTDVDCAVGTSGLQGVGMWLWLCAQPVNPQPDYSYQVSYPFIVSLRCHFDSLPCSRRLLAIRVMSEFLDFEKELMKISNEEYHRLPFFTPMVNTSGNHVRCKALGYNTIGRHLRSLS